MPERMTDMRKIWLVLVLTLCLVLPGAAMAAEMPDTEVYFGALAEKGAHANYKSYDYWFSENPAAALKGYVQLLTDKYGFETTASRIGEEQGMWRLTCGEEDIRIDLDKAGKNYRIYMSVYKTIDCRKAETWDWKSNSIVEAEKDMTVLPDFLKHDSAGTYYYCGSGYSFRADSTSAACVDAVKAYADLLEQRGYILVDSAEERLAGADMYKWYFHSGVNGLEKIEDDIDAHIMLRMDVRHDDGYSALDVQLVPGLTMEGYDNTPASP